MTVIFIMDIKFGKETRLTDTNISIVKYGKNDSLKKAQKPQIANVTDSV